MSVTPQLIIKAAPADGAGPVASGGRRGAEHRPKSTMAANYTETWFQTLEVMLKALNRTVSRVEPCPRLSTADEEEKDSYAYMYILFMMLLFALTVGSLILSYTRSREVDKPSDPYHMYIKNRVTMI
ncbi:potassium voltage-gated channel subfamily E member 3 [Protobothrops mucrosquamatus]|uniref:potassium voltage-gated channel subfamily E member 3 n=1 Tax=Protobothrops mucrosquamatus TaxID=103944 RepID=UPI0010FAE9D8|nr:potassium voltage-gated channel subfamily E member 3 [Protobothrops mucrosquamatus]